MARLIQTDLGDVCEPNESNSDSETNNSAGVETIKKAIYSVFLQLLLSQTKLTGKSFLFKKKKKVITGSGNCKFGFMAWRSSWGLILPRCSSLMPGVRHQCAAFVLLLLILPPTVSECVRSP